MSSSQSLLVVARQSAILEGQFAFDLQVNGLSSPADVVLAASSVATSQNHPTFPSFLDEPTMRATIFIALQSTCA